MDVYCPICGEPWDMEELHYVLLEDAMQVYFDRGLEPPLFRPAHGFEYHMQNPGVSPTIRFKDAYRLFKRVGCELFGTSHGDVVNEEAVQRARVLYDVLGDDADAAASFLDE